MKKFILLAITVISLFAMQAQAQQSDMLPIKITTWNTEWLGCEENGPYDENLQISNVAKAIKIMNSDIICLQEVTQSSDYPSIKTLVSLLGDEYAGNIWTWSTQDCSQNQGIIYKKSKVQFVKSSFVVGSGNNYKYYWASGRYPVLYDVNIVTKNGTVPLSLINIHAKASTRTSDKEEDYSRRKGGSEGLKSVLDGNSYKSRRIIVIGDFNDYLAGTQCYSQTDSPYKNFIDDNANYSGITSTLNNGRLIDNMVISNELFNNFIEDSIYQETRLRNSITNFSNTTSDHTPVSAVFDFSGAGTGNEGTTAAAGAGKLELYPNPVKNELVVSGGTGSAFEIYNTLGKKIIKGSTANGKTIDVSSLPAGIYVIKIGSYIAKFIKE